MSSTNNNHQAQEQQEQKNLTTNNFYSDTIITIGHVDSGKSTIVGQLLREFDTVQHGPEIRKLELSETYNKNPPCGARSNPYRDYISSLHKYEYERSDNISITPKIFHFPTTSTTSISEEEKETSSTIATTNGAAVASSSSSSSETTTTKNNFSFTIIDAPGHRDFLGETNRAIAGATIALFVVSAARNEFEAGMGTPRNPGATRTHLLSAYALGVKRYIFVLNKMDTESYAQSRFQEVKDEISAFVKRVVPGPMLAKNCTFVPLSALNRENLFSSSESSSTNDESSSGKQQRKKPEMPWYEGHPTLIEALQEASIAIFKLNNRGSKLGDIQQVSPKLTEEQQKKAAERYVKPLTQDSAPLRALVIKKNSSVKETIRRLVSTNQISSSSIPASKYLDNITEIIQVTVVSGVLKLGDVLVFEPGTNVRKVVSMSFADSSVPIKFLDDEFEEEEEKGNNDGNDDDDHEESGNNNNSSSITSSTSKKKVISTASVPVEAFGPSSIVGLGLIPLSDEEKENLKRDKQRQDELELFYTNADETRKAMETHQKETEELKQRTYLSRKRNARKRGIHKTPGRFKKQHQVQRHCASLQKPFTFEIKAGNSIGLYLHADAPKSYYADKDFINAQFLVTRAPASRSIRTGFSPTVDCGTQHIPCRIEILAKIDKITGKPIEVEEDPSSLKIVDKNNKNVKKKVALRTGELGNVRITPVYSHLPIVVDPLFFEGRGSNSRTILGRLVFRDHGVVVAAGAVRSLWMYRKWPFLIRFFGKGKSSEALQVWNVLVNVCLFLSWTS